MEVSMHRFYVDPETGEVVERKYESEPVSDEVVAIPLRFTRNLGLNEVVRNMVRSERLAREAEEMGMESFEESDDFEVGDDYEPSSPYEEEFEGLPVSRLRELMMEEEKKKPAYQGEESSEKSAPPRGKPEAEEKKVSNSDVSHDLGSGS